MEAGSNIQCPRCGSVAWYHFGKTTAGKRRYICKVCSRQFIIDYSYKSSLKNCPQCPVCVEAMHVYMRDVKGIRFRCSKYPGCRSFRNVTYESVDAAHACGGWTSPTPRNRSARKEEVVA